jgi:hypothetical protein
MVINFSCLRTTRVQLHSLISVCDYQSSKKQKYRHTNLFVIWRASFSFYSGIFFGQSFVLSLHLGQSLVNHKTPPRYAHIHVHRSICYTRYITSERDIYVERASKSDGHGAKWHGQETGVMQLRHSVTNMSEANSECNDTTIRVLQYEEHEWFITISDEYWSTIIN